MNLIGYVNRFKDYSFFEKPFTDVDAALFAAVVYSLFEKIGPDYLHPNDVFYFHELTSEQIIDINESSVFKKQNTKVLNIMKDSIRYKDVGVTLIMSVIEQEVIEQFCAMTFLLPKVGPVVVYRGTDTSIEGWRENLNLTIHPITASHLDSVDYLNIFSKAYSNIPFIVIGHSKGGNLAYYATLYAPYDVTCHITHSYSFDGTGFVDDSFTKRDTYHKLLPQMIQIVPRQSFVGELFENPPNKTFIKSKKKSTKSSKTKSSSKKGTYVASKNSKIRHFSNCKYVSKIKSYNKLTFKTKSAAIKAGKTKSCSSCHA